MRRMLIALSLIFSAAAFAAPTGLKVDRAKVAAEHQMRLSQLEHDFSHAAVEGKRQLLLRGHRGYVYGDSGSVMFELRRVNDLAAEAGAPKVGQALAERASRSGRLVSLQHELVSAVGTKRASMADVLLPRQLDSIISFANDLKFSGHEIVDILGAYGFSRWDVQRYSKYQLP